jgi:hypothetical protein
MQVFASKWRDDRALRRSNLAWLYHPVFHHPLQPLADQAEHWLRDGPKVEQPASNLDMADAIPY